MGSQRTFLRQWAGRFNYMTNWLTPAMKAHLHTLHSMCSEVGKSGQPMGRIAKDEVCQALKTLVEFYLEKIPVLWGVPDNNEFTVVVTDANQGSWASVVLVPVRRELLGLQGANGTDSADNCELSSERQRAQKTEAVAATACQRAHETGAEAVEDRSLPAPFHFESLMRQVATQCPELGVDPREWVLVPVRWDGDRWPITIQRWSSTWRERAAAMKAIGRNRSFLSGPVVLACDNCNIPRSWGDMEQHLTAGLIPDFEDFCAYVWRSIQISRKDPAMSLVDAVARELEDESFKLKKTRAAQEQRKESGPALEATANPGIKVEMDATAPCQRAHDTAQEQRKEPGPALEATANPGIKRSMECDNQESSDPDEYIDGPMTRSRNQRLAHKLTEDADRTGDSTPGKRARVHDPGEPQDDPIDRGSDQAEVTSQDSISDEIFDREESDRNSIAEEQSEGDRGYLTAPGNSQSEGMISAPPRQYSHPLRPAKKPGENEAADVQKADELLSYLRRGRDVELEMECDSEQNRSYLGNRQPRRSEGWWEAGSSEDEDDRGADESEPLATESGWDVKAWALERFEDHYSTEEKARYPLEDDPDSPGLRMDDRNRVIVPEILARDLTLRVHQMGHGGRKATLDLLERFSFYVKNAGEVVQQVCDECMGCLQGKSQSTRTARGRLPEGKQPFEFCSIDLGQLSKTFSLVVVRDHFTKYVEADVLQREDAESVTRALDGIFSRMGYPSHILSDNGKVFSSAIVRKWAEDHGVSWHFTPVYSPQSNGGAERTIRSIKEGIRATLSSNPQGGRNMFDISIALNQVIYRLNASRKGDGLTARDLIFSYKEKCPFLPGDSSGERIDFKGKMRPGDIVLIKEVHPNGGLGRRFKQKGVVVRHVGNYRYEIHKEDSKQGSLEYIREDRLKKVPRETAECVAAWWAEENTLDHNVELQSQEEAFAGVIVAEKVGSHQATQLVIGGEAVEGSDNEISSTTRKILHAWSRGKFWKNPFPQLLDDPSNSSNPSKWLARQDRAGYQGRKGEESPSKLPITPPRNRMSAAQEGAVIHSSWRYNSLSLSGPPLSNDQGHSRIPEGGVTERLNPEGISEGETQRKKFQFVNNVVVDWRVLVAILFYEYWSIWLTVLQCFVSFHIVMRKRFDRHARPGGNRRRFLRPIRVGRKMEEQLSPGSPGMSGQDCISNGEARASKGVPEGSSPVGSKVEDYSWELQAYEEVCSKMESLRALLYGEEISGEEIQELARWRRERICASTQVADEFIRRAIAMWANGAGIEAAEQRYLASFIVLKDLPDEVDDECLSERILWALEDPESRIQISPLPHPAAPEGVSAPEGDSRDDPEQREIQDLLARWKSLRMSQRRQEVAQALWDVFAVMPKGHGRDQVLAGALLEVNELRGAVISLCRLSWRDIVAGCIPWVSLEPPLHLPREPTCLMDMARFDQEWTELTRELLSRPERRPAEVMEELSANRERVENPVCESAGIIPVDVGEDELGSHTHLANGQLGRHIHGP